MSKRVICLLVVIAAAVGTWPITGRIALIEPSVAASQAQTVPVEQVLIRGNRRIPESTIRIWIATREGDPYNPEQLERDLRSLYAQGHFEDVRVFVEEGTRGSFIAVKPNPAYYHKKLPKSSPQFFTVVYKIAHGDPVFEENIAAIKKAIDFATLKNMLGK